MDRRLLIAAGLATLAAPLAQAQDAGFAPDDRYPAPPPPPPPPPGSYADGAAGGSQPTYRTDNGGANLYGRRDGANRVSDFLGVTAEIRRCCGGADVQGQRPLPTGYIAGEEASGAFVFGLRYGRGLLYMKGRQAQEVFWQGPSVGFDAGGNASRVFTLAYNLQYPDMIYRRFPGIEGSAYFIGGLGVNYQKADDVVLAPMRAGVGFRLGANVGYLSYSRKRNIIPL